MTIKDEEALGEGVSRGRVERSVGFRLRAQGIGQVKGQDLLKMDQSFLLCGCLLTSAEEARHETPHRGHCSVQLSKKKDQVALTKCLQPPSYRLLIFFVKYYITVSFLCVFTILTTTFKSLSHNSCTMPRVMFKSLTSAKVFFPVHEHKKYTLAIFPYYLPFTNSSSPVRLLSYPE